MPRSSFHFALHRSRNTPDEALAQNFTIDGVFLKQPHWIDFDFLFWINEEKPGSPIHDTAIKQWAEKCVDHKYNSKEAQSKWKIRVIHSIQELSGITLVLIRCLTIHGCFRTSVRGKRFCGSYRSNYRRVMSALRSANYCIQKRLTLVIRSFTSSDKRTSLSSNFKSTFAIRR